MVVIKFNNGMYWCGNNATSTQLRKALIFNSFDYAKRAGDKVLERASKNDFIQRHDSKVPIEISSFKSYKIMEVELREVGEVIDYII